MYYLIVSHKEFSYSFLMSSKVEWSGGGFKNVKTKEVKTIVIVVEGLRSGFKSLNEPKTERENHSGD